MKKILLYILLFIVNCQLLIAAVRYVSHSGSNTPPYLTWETAADSIMSAINISSSGDTIYVANGVYEEQVVMIPGLSLIGAGMDSCVIDTKQLITMTDDISVRIADSCLLTGFHIYAASNSSRGEGIAGGGDENCIIKDNRVTTSKYAIVIDATYFGNADVTVYNNILENVNIGIELFNSNSLIRKNIISNDPNSTAAIVAGINIGAFDYTYKPIIDSNLFYSTHAYGIHQSYGAKPVISNNSFILHEGDGLFLGYSDTILVYNNLIFGDGGEAISNAGTQCSKIYNNCIGGRLITGIVAGTSDIILNNVISNSEVGIEKVFGQSPPTVKYNCLWDNLQNYSGFSNSDTSNIFTYPMVVNDDSARGELDFHLQMFSPLIDRGDPNILDKDGSRSDIGLYGGPFGESYNYLDLPPRTPINFTAILDSNNILLKWNRNTEADFSNYKVFRDTIQGFPIDSTTFVATILDTFYILAIPPGINNFYFRVTAVDNQGNESEPSEERHIEIVSVKDRPKIFSSYQLYQNYPNPFNPSTKISYRLNERGYVKLYVYDIKGELVQTLVNNYQEAGFYEVEFSASSIQYPESSIRNQASSIQYLASGIYIYQIMVKSENNIPVFSDIKKMVLLK